VRAAGAEVVAVSVDPPEKSEVVRRQLRLPFTILCDTERHVVRKWNVYNPAEKGGIAIPAVFIVGPDRVVRLASVDTVVTRVPVSEIVRILGIAAEAQHPGRKRYIPSPSCFFRAVRNAIRLGVRSGK